MKILRRGLMSRETVATVIMIAAVATESALAEQARMEVVGGATKFQQNENYAGGTKVSGELLTGLSHLSSSPRLDLDNVRIDYRGSDTAETVCVRFTTGDGRYWALAPYLGGGRYKAPPLLSIPTKFVDTLSGYKTGDFLALAVLGGCDAWDAGDKVLVPMRMGKSTDDDALLVHINVNRGRPSVFLIGADGAEHKGDCHRAQGGGHVTYSRTCAIAIPEALRGRLATLRISVRSLVGGSRTKDYDVALW
jgi:hypothetical protein